MRAAKVAKGQLSLDAAVTAIAERRVARFIAIVSKANKEEAVIVAYRRLIGADDEWDRPFSTDGLFQGTLFEFKHGMSLVGTIAPVLAQLCAYLRLFYMKGVYKGTSYPLPLRVAVCTEQASACVPIKTLAPFFMDDHYDWKRAASNPDPVLIKALQAVAVPVYAMDDAAQIHVFLDALRATGDAVKQLVTRENFVAVFATWRAQFATELSQQDAALAYLYDLQNLRYINEEAGSVLLGPPGKGFELRVPVERYKAFWHVFKLPPSNKELAAILARKDQLVAMQLRRETGEFFTPADIANVAHGELLQAAPDAYENWNWWDPACGLGNLTLACPEMTGRLFLSTLNKQDVDAVRQSGESPEALVFDYDFLNKTDEELPAALRAKLLPGSKWIFFLNPPFAAGNDLTASFGGANGAKVKTGVSDTRVGNAMEAQKLGHACQNTYAQFMYRIQQLVDTYKLNAMVGIFSVAAFATGPAYGDFRNHWRSTCSLVRAFTFQCKEFAGASGAWPVLFSLWRSAPSASFASIEAAVVERDTTDELVRTGTKVFQPARAPMTKMIQRPKADTLRPPMNGALSIKTEGNVRLDRWAADSLAFLNSVANDVQNSAQKVALLSGPSSDGNGWSVTADNFEASLVCFGARKLIRATWLNNRDEFEQPEIASDEYKQFAADAAVWTLFHGSNQTSSLGKVAYDNVTYDIPNHFFWIEPKDMVDWTGLPAPIFRQCEKAKPRFVAPWLKGQTFSTDARAVLEAGTDLVRLGASKRSHAEHKFQLDRWDAGWYQIRNGLYGKDVPFQATPEMVAALETFQNAYRALTERLRPLVYSLGMLPAETRL
jgi:hypothetical protein